MKCNIVSGCFLFLLIITATVGHAHAAFPYDYVIQYECEQAKNDRAATGFACNLARSDSHGAAMEIILLHDVGDDPEKKRLAAYKQALLMARFADAGGLLLRVINAKQEPYTAQKCSRDNPLKSFWCGKWEPLPTP